MSNQKEVFALVKKYLPDQKQRGKDVDTGEFITLQFLRNKLIDQGYLTVKNVSGKDVYTEVKPSTTRGKVTKNPPKTSQQSRTTKKPVPKTTTRKSSTLKAPTKKAPTKPATPVYGNAETDMYVELYAIIEDDIVDQPIPEVKQIEILIKDSSNKSLSRQLKQDILDELMDAANPKTLLALVNKSKEPYITAAFVFGVLEHIPLDFDVFDDIINSFMPKLEIYQQQANEARGSDYANKQYGTPYINASLIYNYMAIIKKLVDIFDVDQSSITLALYMGANNIGYYLIAKSISWGSPYTQLKHLIKYYSGNEIWIQVMEDLLEKYPYSPKHLGELYVFNAQCTASSEVGDLLLNYKPEFNYSVAVPPIAESGNLELIKPLRKIDKPIISRALNTLIDATRRSSKYTPMIEYLLEMGGTFTNAKYNLLTQAALYKDIERVKLALTYCHSMNLEEWDYIASMAINNATQFKGEYDLDNYQEKSYEIVRAIRTAYVFE